MRVAVIGGTGFVGGYVVDALLAGGHTPVLLVRPGSEGKVRHREDCVLVAGSLESDEASWNSLLRDADAVIYNVGILREDRSRGITFEAMQHQGVVRAVNAARELGVQRLLLMSANGVESAATPYQVSKLRAEEYARASGIAVTVFRPSVVFGAPRGTMEIATQLYRDMIAPPLPAVSFFNALGGGRGEFEMSPVHVEDVADCFVHALEDAATIGKTYILGGPERLTWAEMLRRVAAAAGRRKWLLPMPVELMKVAAALLDWLPAFPVTRDQLTMLAEGNTADPDVIAALLGRDPRPFDAANLRYLRA